MSKAPTSKKFVLVSLDHVDDPKNIARKMRRYLNGNKLNHIFSSNVEEMKEFLDKVHNRMLSEDAVFDISDGISTAQADIENMPIVSVASNQEILEKWARETFSADSSEIRLLFGTPAEPVDNLDDDESSDRNSPRDNDIDDDMEQDILVKEVPKIFSVNSVDSESADNKNDDIMQTCLLCKRELCVGKTRNTKLRRQAFHVMDDHYSERFNEVSVLKRYKCLRCNKFVPAYKSPCEHITDQHPTEEEETELADLWSTDELFAFNQILGKCFCRTLPVPRNRRAGGTFAIAPKSKRSKQGGTGGQMVVAGTEKETVRPEPKETEHTEKKEEAEVQGPAPPPKETGEVVVVNEIHRINHDHDYYNNDEDDEEEDDPFEEYLHRRRIWGYGSDEDDEADD